MDNIKWNSIEEARKAAEYIRSKGEDVMQGATIVEVIRHAVSVGYKG